MTFARTQMKAMGYEEAPEAFVPEYVPKSKMAREFYLNPGTASQVKSNQDNYLVEVPIEVQIFRAPQADSRNNRDQAIHSGDAIVKAFTQIKARGISGPGLLDVSFESMSPVRLNATNAKGVTIKIKFKIVVLVATR